MQTLRRILFYVFAAIYIIVCPLLILYAFGYIYRPGEPKGIVTTGLIYLSTAPSNAAVYINNDKFTQKTPTIIRELLPGEYNIRLVLDDYKTWEETIPVEGEKATVLDKILLLPLKWEEETLLPDKAQDLIPIPESEFFLLIGNDLEDTTIYNYKDNASYKLFEEKGAFQNYKILSYFIVKRSSAIILHVGSSQEKKTLWVKLKKEKAEIKDLTSLFQGWPEKLKWLPYSAQEELFAFFPNHIDKLDIASNRVYPEYVQDVKGYGLFNHEIYVLTTANLFLKTDYNAKDIDILLNDPELMNMLFKSKDFFDIDILEGEFILFLGKNGELIANKLPYKLVEEGIKGFNFDLASRKLLVWKDNKIGILDFLIETEPDAIFEKGPRLTWVYEGARGINQAFWVYEASHILFCDRGNVYLVGIEKGGEFKVNRLIKVKRRSLIYYSEEQGKLYFLDSRGSNLKSIKIIAEKALLPEAFTDALKDKTKALEVLTSKGQKE